jgi:uncharacterized membrane protein YjjP (DUF1212 family)
MFQFPNLFVEAIVYELLAFAILFLLTLWWYGDWEQSLSFTIVGFTVFTAHYYVFHSLVQTKNKN